MEDTQKKLHEWGIVSSNYWKMLDILTENKSDLTNYWKNKYGMSLTAYITKQIKNNISFKECYKKLCNENPSSLHKKILGSVCGRYAEQRMAFKRRFSES